MNMINTSGCEKTLHRRRRPLGKLAKKTKLGAGEELLLPLCMTKASVVKGVFCSQTPIINMDEYDDMMNMNMASLTYDSLRNVKAKERDHSSIRCKGLLENRLPDDFIANKSTRVKVIVLRSVFRISSLFLRPRPWQFEI